MPQVGAGLFPYRYGRRRGNASALGAGDEFHGLTDGKPTWGASAGRLDMLASSPSIWPPGKDETPNELLDRLVAM